MHNKIKNGFTEHLRWAQGRKFPWGLESRWWAFNLRLGKYLNSRWPEAKCTRGKAVWLTRKPKVSWAGWLWRSAGTKTSRQQQKRLLSGLARAFSSTHHGKLSLRSVPPTLLQATPDTSPSCHLQRYPPIWQPSWWNRPLHSGGCSLSHTLLLQLTVLPLCREHHQWSGQFSTGLDHWRNRWTSSFGTASCSSRQRQPEHPSILTWTEVHPWCIFLFPSLSQDTQPLTVSRTFLHSHLGWWQGKWGVWKLPLES